MTSTGPTRTVTGFTAARMLEIENESVVSGLVDVNGNLLLSTRGGTEIDAGNVIGPQGDPGPPGDPGVPGDPGIQGPPGDSSLSAGTISLWASDVAPSNWLICDGSAVSRTGYASLFAAIGVMYGAGDGSTTFNIPNLKGKTPVGLDATQTEFNALGKAGGEKTHILSITEMPSHGHVQDNHSHTVEHILPAASHTHTLDSGYAEIWIAAVSSNQVGMRRISVPAFTPTHGLTTGTTGAGALTSASTSAAALAGTTDPSVDSTTNTLLSRATNQNTGGGTAHNNLQPYSVVNFIIKTTNGDTPDDSQLTQRVGVLENTAFRPSSVSPAPDTTVVRTSDSRVKTGSPLEVDDAVTVQYLADSNTLERQLRRAQASMVGGGVRTVTSTTIAWDESFRVSVDRSSFSPSAYWDITMPPNGTVIPVTGDVAYVSTTVANGAITLGSYDTLYYDLPVGGSYATDPSRFHIVRTSYFNSVNSDVPANWIAIVRGNGGRSTSSAYLWGDGKTSSYWTNISLTNNWVNYDSTVYGTAQYKVCSDGRVVLKGLVKDGTTTIATFNSKFAPNHQSIFTQIAGSGLARVDVLIDGSVYLRSYISGGTNAYVSLEGISWYPS